MGYSKFCRTLLDLTILILVLFFLRTEKLQKKTIENVVIDYTESQGAWKSIWDPCQSRTSSCKISRKINGAYILSLYDFSSSTIDDKDELKIDNTTYYDYAYASINRLRSLTRFPIILLIAEDSLNRYRSKLQEIEILGGVEIAIVPFLFIQKYIQNKNSGQISQRQSREKHKYTYYNLYLFSSEFPLRYKTLVFLDIDTFLLRNIDEVFCLNTHFTAAERVNNFQSDFNSGVYVYSRKKGDFEVLLKEYKKYLSGSNELKRGIQAVLNRAFDSSQTCLPAGYNCGGFQGDLKPQSVYSLKCPFKGEHQLLTQMHPVLHLKLSMSKYRLWLPSISCLWIKYLPAEAKSRVGWLQDMRLECHT